VGADCVIHAGCVLRERTRLGDRVVLQPGVVLGGDGFGYAITEAGELEAMPQLGRVVVADDVEIGANSTVDRGTLGDTCIERGAKLDNLVQVGHNVVVGESAVLVAQSGIAGSARIGRNAVIMSQAGIPDHATIGARAYVGPKSGVHGDVADGARVMGYPHRDMRAFQRIFAALGLLPALVARVRALERAPEAGAPAKRPRKQKPTSTRSGTQKQTIARPRTQKPTSARPRAKQKTRSGRRAKPSR
jgi:UDP-3-O-[3-hydroxymyristoyl] glucosamine N-acyltransferase